AIEDANKNLDPKLPDGTTIDVDKDGTVTVKYPDGTADIIPRKDVVKKSDAATNNPVAPDNKVPVSDPKALTPEEKKAVEEAIKKKNPTLPEKTEISVANDGTVTVKYPDGSTDTIPGTEVVKKSLASETNVVVPSPKIIVKDPKNLTSDEKTAVSKKVLDANPNLPRNTTITVGDDGKVTITYNDNSVDTIDGSDIVVQAESEKNNPIAPDNKVPVSDPKALTPEEKKSVEEAIKKKNPTLPENTEISVSNDGTVTVKYPDGSTDTIPGTDVVKKSDAATNNPVAPDNKVPVTDPKALTPEEKKSVEEAIKKKNPTLPEKTEISVSNDGTVTVTYPDKTTDTIPGKDVVKKSDAATNNPVAPDNKVPVSDPKALTPEEKKSVEDAIKKKNPTLPENTEITVGNDGTVTVKYPDGSTDTIPGTDVVRKYYYNPSSSGSSSNSNTSNSDRLNGKDRVETAVKVSRASYPYGARAVILANKDKFPDVLTAVPFSVQIGAPILFTNTNSLPKETIDEIARLNPSMVYINGGEHSVSMSIEQLMKKQGRSVHRFNGVDRYDTARLIGEKIRERGNKKVVEIASGETFPDALSISSLAVKENAPILLSKRNDLTISTKSALASWDVEKVTIAGQTATMSSSVESSVINGFNTGIANTDSIFSGSKNTRRIGGADRYETSALIAKYAVPESKLGVYTSGEVFADALVAGPYAGLKNAPVLLVSKNNVPSSIANYTKTSKIDRAVVVGGASTVYDSTFDMIKSLIKR
ncbi:cell wall-binding repeat-containing protein, partial [Peptostreptococcus porci]|uniref:cell wall-binding repeat-containing protein n=1 Tax=Peptostreptococcus porci TaxID=2652282 RepID=UPI0023F46F88